MKKAIVIGCPGAGKSTFARKLSDVSGLPLYYLDLMWHKPDRTNISREEFEFRQGQILQSDCWIIDGNYLHTLEPRLKACDTVFFLDYPVEVCLAGARERIGRKRPDMPWVETEFDPDFLQWILDFPQKQLPQIYQLLEIYRWQKEIFIFHSRKEASDLLSTFQSNL